jgi:nitroreductase
MAFYETFIKRRSIRRFKDMPVPYQILKNCVDAAGLAPSAANLQPREYLVVDEEPLLYSVFDTLKWANYTIALVVALGYPNESTIAEEFSGSIKYWQDERNVLHVPKRKLGDILHRNGDMDAKE